MKRAEKRINLSTPTMHGEEMGFVQEAFDKNWIAPLGFNCDSFEKEMDSYLNVGIDSPYQTLALCSGTAALHLAMKLAGMKRGDRVFCSDMTFAATVNPVSYEGGVQVFIDSEPDSWNMDPVALEKAFQKYPDTKFVVIAHLYGTPSKMDEIMAICEKHGAILAVCLLPIVRKQERRHFSGLLSQESHSLGISMRRLVTTTVCPM